jgi:hypothetical protein
MANMLFYGRATSSNTVFIAQARPSTQVENSWSNISQTVMTIAEAEARITAFETERHKAAHRWETRIVRIHEEVVQ